MTRPRTLGRQAERQQANADLLGMPLTDYLALTRRQRKQLLHAARQREGT
jgi:hypothetical protein